MKIIAFTSSKQWIHLKAEFSIKMDKINIRTFFVPIVDRRRRILENQHFSFGTWLRRFRSFWFATIKCPARWAYSQEQLFAPQKQENWKNWNIPMDKVFLLEENINILVTQFKWLSWKKNTWTYWGALSGSWNSFPLCTASVLIALSFHKFISAFASSGVSGSDSLPALTTSKTIRASD